MFWLTALGIPYNCFILSTAHEMNTIMPSMTSQNSYLALCLVYLLASQQILETRAPAQSLLCGVPAADMHDDGSPGALCHQTR
jgi:hypothetical protein